MKKFLSAVFILILAATPAIAQSIEYFEDPVYQSLNAGDHHPMEDMILLAENNDLRAQYILGDLYSKGKGGFVKNEKKAKEWFEKSAMNGYPFSFIRLAAMAKRKNRPVEAYQWYTLGLDYLDRSADRKWVSEARKTLAERKKLTPEEIKKATDGARTWERQKAEEMRKIREEARVKAAEAREAAIKENAAKRETAAPKETPKKEDSKQKPKTEYKYRNGDN